jgi:hypothetical protein
MAISSALLHGVLGLRRPIHLRYLSLAGIMLCLAVFLYLQVDFYRATTSEDAVEAVRRQVTVSQGVMGWFLVFIPAYTGVRLPRQLIAVYVAGLLVLTAMNLVAPHGLYFSTAPTLVHSMFLGEHYSAVIPPPLALPQYAYALYYFSLIVVALVCAVTMFRRGQRQRGLILAVALIVVFALAIVDLVRDAIGASWPYVTAYGIVIFGLVMSVQLAHDFRAQADALATLIARAEIQARHQESILEALRALQRNLQTPADELESGMNSLTTATPREKYQVRRLHRCVSRLRELSGSM